MDNGKDLFSVDVLRNLTSHSAALKCLQMSSQSLPKKSADAAPKDLQRLLAYHRQQQHGHQETLYASYLSFQENSEHCTPPAQLAGMARQALAKHYTVSRGVFAHHLELPS